MKITIVAVGKIKENYFKDAIGEYSKRLSRYCSLSILEVMDEKTPDKATAGEEEAILLKEASKIEKVLDTNGKLIVLAIEGRNLDSVQFSEMIAEYGIRGTSHIQFVIGGSLGLHSSIKSKADESISFSKMTFPHQLMRVILCEQIYRCYRIMNHEPYHK